MSELTNDELRILMDALQAFESNYFGAYPDHDVDQWERVYALAFKLVSERIRRIRRP